MDKNWLRQYPAGVAAKIQINDQDSLVSVLRTVEKKFAMFPAITSMSKTFNFSELADLSDAFGAYLQSELGVKKGDRIAIMLPNIHAFPICFIGAQKIGAVCVNTNPLYTERELEHQLRDSGATTIVILDMMADKLQNVIHNTSVKNIVIASIPDLLGPVKRSLIQFVLKVKKMIPKNNLSAVKFEKSLAIGRTKKIQFASLNANDVCLLQYTGGTTGVSKGAILSHRNILANVEQIRAWASQALVEGEETVMTALPLYHIFALSVNFLAFLSMGSHMILVPKPVPIINTIKIFKKYKITVLTGVNTLFNALNNHPKFQKLKPNGIKIALAGGMALQQSVSEAWEKITGTPIVEGFGLTEASPVTHCNPVGRKTPVNSIGVPLPSTEAKIVDDEGKEVPNGEVGELLIYGPQVMRGYWQNQSETDKILRSDWLWTGDIAKRNDDGYFFIVDRKKDMILVSGFNVYPTEIEEIVSQHPKVLECAAVGIPDSASGEAIKLFVVAKDSSLTTAEIQEHCKSLLTNYKRPKIIEFRTELPKTNVGKILRRNLRQAS